MYSNVKCVFLSELLFYNKKLLKSNLLVYISWYCPYYKIVCLFMTSLEKKII